MNYQNDQTKWPDFLAEFSRRNRGRRARFERFDGRGVAEEQEEARLENITVEMIGNDAPRIIVTRHDISTTSPSEWVTTIPQVQRISPQLDIVNSEAGLEIEDRHAVLVLLRLESLVDGAS